MDEIREKIERLEAFDKRPQTGYTLIEVLGVTAIVVILVLMTQGMMKNYKRYTVEETAVQRLKELSRFENTYRTSNDPTINPEGTYGTFFDLQNAGFIPEFYEEDDVRRRTVNAFVPFYRLNFKTGAGLLVETETETETETSGEQMNSFQYMIEAIPLPNNMNLKTFYVREDGEVYFVHNQIWLQPR